MTFEDIEVSVFVKRVTITRNGLAIPWSCYGINVALNELRQSYSEETVKEIEDYIYQECAYITKGEPELFEEEKVIDDLLKKLQAKEIKKKFKKGDDQFKLDL